jgi:hypothetical protein
MPSFIMRSRDASSEPRVEGDPACESCTEDRALDEVSNEADRANSQRFAHNPDLKAKQTKLPSES